jgi:hypothetical protein
VQKKLTFQNKVRRKDMQMKQIVLSTMIMIMLLAVGCGQLRFAPGETQKQNVYLHHRTVQASATKAHQENVSDTLQSLTSQAAKQSDAIMAYYGLPSELPATSDIEDLLSNDNEELTAQARSEAIQRPDIWQVTDGFLELGIALAGLIGGVYGNKAVAALNLTRKKSVALKEIITNNELFKQNNPQSVVAFKQAQQLQSDATRSLVAEMK